jgi:hypothetical protein
LPDFDVETVHLLPRLFQSFAIVRTIQINSGPATWPFFLIE